MSVRLSDQPTAQRPATPLTLPEQGPDRPADRQEERQSVHRHTPDERQTDRQSLHLVHCPQSIDAPGCLQRKLLAVDDLIG